MDDLQLQEEPETKPQPGTSPSQPTSSADVAGQPRKDDSSSFKCGAAVPNSPETGSSDSSAHLDQYPPGDGPIWLQYLASGDWLGAFMTMEESSNFRKLEEHDKHARLASTLVYLEQDACVRDFLERPSPVQPFDSLLAALFVRAYYLPRNVWSKRGEVTWEKALACLPEYLASRLVEAAVDYLHTFPVVLDENSAQGVAENTVRPAPSQPCPNPESDSISEPTASGTSGEASEGAKETEMETSETDLEEGSAAASTVPGLAKRAGKCKK